MSTYNFTFSIGRHVVVLSHAKGNLFIPSLCRDKNISY